MNEKLQTIREALLATGYQERKSGMWIKPVGHHGLTYSEEKNVWANYFYDAADKVSCWSHKDLKHDLEYYGTYIQQLQSFECYTRLSMAHGPGFEMNIVDFNPSINTAEVKT